MEHGTQTVSVQLLKQTLLIAKSRGVDTRAVVLAAGIDPTVMRSRSNHISSAVYGKVWLAIADALDDEFFGEDPHPMRRGSFALMAQASLGASNGEQAIQRAVSFMRLVLDNIEGRVTRREGNVWLEMRYRSARPTMFAYATYFILIYGLVCWLVGRRIPIVRTVLECDVPPAVDEYRLIFCEDMVFSATTAYVELSEEFLSLPVVQSAKNLALFLNNAPGNFVTKYRQPNPVASRVHRLLASMPVDQWPDADAMAKLLQQAPATMRRRLRSEGVSYQTVKDRARCRLAVEMLKNPETTVLDVAIALGYAEPSAFHRAFRKWMGTSPHKYRSVALNKVPT